MLITSVAFQTAAINCTRVTAAKISFGIYDVTARDDASPLASSSQSFTDVGEIIDNVRTPTYKMATFEPDYLRLDGSFYLMPDDVDSADTDAWWSAEMADENGEFDVTPTVEINFNDHHSSLGIGLIFDSVAYCSGFKVSWYDGETILDTVNVTDNTDYEAFIDNEIENYNSLVIEFNTTHEPYRYVKLVEVVFGIDEVFINDEIIEAKTTEEVDPLASTLSINTLTFTVLNTDQKFNMLNPSGIYAYLQNKQPIRAKSGLMLPGGEYEYVDLGTFYLSEWSNASGITASLEAQDIIGVLDSTTYYMSQFWSKASLETVVAHILADAGISDYTIDDSAADEVVTGYIPVKSHREALQDVALACSCVVRINRIDGTILFTKLDRTTTVTEIDYNLIIGEPTITQKDLITSVKATQYTYSEGVAGTTVYEDTFEVDGTETYAIEFTTYPVDPNTVTVALTGNGDLDSYEVSAVACLLTIANGAGEVTLTITGTPYDESTKTLEASLDTLSAGDVEQTAIVEDNNLITSINALTIAQNTLDYFQYRIKQKFTYWDNPATQSGDNVNIETMFANFKEGIMEKKNLTFAPNLSSSVEVVG
jgi:hypothetical protein